MPASWETTVWFAVVSPARFTQAATLNEDAVLMTGPDVAICCPVFAANEAALPVQVTPVAVAWLPAPDASGTAVPDVWVRGNEAAGTPAPATVPFWPSWYSAVTWDAVSARG